MKTIGISHEFCLQNCKKSEMVRIKLSLYTSFAINGKRYIFNQQLAMIGAMLRLAKNKININAIAYTIV